MGRVKIFNELMKLLLKSNEYINRYESIPRKYGSDDILYQAECHTIDIIGRNSNISITEIARHTNKSKSAVSQMVDRLVKKGFLIKESHPDTERGILLTLTEKGKAVFHYHAKFDSECYSEILENLAAFSDYDLQIFNNIQKTINKSLKTNILSKKDD